MYDLSKNTETKKYLSEILNSLKTSKIIGIFANTIALMNKGAYSYMQDTPIYIMFDNGKCLVVDYMFIDELNIEYREMTDEEKAEYEYCVIKDCFNRITDVHDSYDRNKVINVERSSLEYGHIKCIETNAVTDPYSAWVDGNIIEVRPTEETFGSIEFKMDNGKSFFICPGSAYDDGYSFLWSDDAVEA